MSVLQDLSRSGCELADIIVALTPLLLAVLTALQVGSVRERRARRKHDELARLGAMDRRKDV